MHLQTLVVHAAGEPDRETGAIVPPLHLSTTFERAPDGSFPTGNIYVRDGNPNRRQLELALAKIEGGAAAIAYSSGMAACAAVFQSLDPGDLVVVPEVAYHGTGKLARQHMARWGLRVLAVETSDLGALARALDQRPRLVWLETPSNPLLGITDIAAASAMAHQAGGHGAHEAGVIVCCDNTWATPFLQRPLELGADLVVHATTKYLGGHSDHMGGAVVTRQSEGELFERLRGVQTDYGSVLAPFDCWLALRGLRTLACRMRAHNEGAEAVARFLSNETRAVERVLYPGLSNHPGHEIARRQMRGFGGMLSFVVRGGKDRAMTVASRLQLFRRATSLGGTESLIEHRASVEGPLTRAPEGLLRCSIGLEHADDLIADLAQALEA